MDSVRSVTTGPADWNSYRIYVISTDDVLWSWIKQPVHESQNQEQENLNNLQHTPTIILDSVQSVHPGTSWRFIDADARAELAELLELMEYFEHLLGIEWPATERIEAGSYVLATDGTLWRVGDHEPYIVIDLILRFYSSPTEVNLTLRKDGSIWTWRDSLTFLPASDTTPTEPTLIFVLNE